MNELSSLILKNKRAKYSVMLSLSPEEYKILLFAIEDKDRIYTKYTEEYKYFQALKDKLLLNHETFNIGIYKEAK